MGLRYFPAGKIKTCFRPTLGPLGPTNLKLQAGGSNAPRLLHPYLLGAAVVGRMSPTTAQLPQFCQRRRCYFNCTSFKFLICRPQWAEARRTAELVLGPPGGQNQSFWRASPVNGGPGGGATLNARSAWRSSETHPLAHLWLLSVRAESNTRLSD